MTIERTARVRLIVDRAHYDELVQRAIARARVSVWIATANVKELRVEAPIGSVARARGRYVSVLDTLTALARGGVELRLLHAAPPSRPFREELARHARLAAGGLAMRQCPRVHLKMIAVDGASLYLGSANFTGAGLGAKGDGRRNFEMGVLTDDDALLDAAQARFDRIWSGRECGACRVRASCPAPLDVRRAAKTATTTTATRGAKASAAKTTSAKASAPKTTSAKASAAKTASAKASATKTASAKASATKTSATKASATKTSATKRARATRASARRDARTDQ